MKIPSNSINPTYDETFRVGFWAWLTSSAADRAEWRRRRDAATATGHVARRLQAAYDEAERKAAAHRDAR